mmetsp:Transcript_2485/g.8472  ORF Transcript_2485/g.8472 Transcript_2485/m.8472 type:complete len:203 (+) Transcript_2485:154-762(+)
MGMRVHHVQRVARHCRSAAPSQGHGVRASPRRLGVASRQAASTRGERRSRPPPHAAPRNGAPHPRLPAHATRSRHPHAGAAVRPRASVRTTRGRDAVRRAVGCSPRERQPTRPPPRARQQAPPCAQAARLTHARTRTCTVLADAGTHAARRRSGGGGVRESARAMLKSRGGEHERACGDAPPAAAHEVAGARRARTSASLAM